MKRLLTIVALFAAMPAAFAQDSSALAERLKGGDGKASLELAKLGEKAVPALISVLKEGDVKARGHAAYALAMIGPPAKNAADELARAMQDEDPGLTSQAAYALGKLGSAGGPAALKVLQTGEAKSSVLAARALAGMKAPVKGAAAPLLAALKKESTPQNQTAFIDALGSQGPSAAEAVPYLVELAQNGKTPPVHVVRALGGIGSGAKEAVPYLTEILKKKEPGPITLHAVQALGQIGVRSADISTALLDLMKEDSQPRMVLLESLSKAGGVTKETLPALSQGMRDKDQTVRLYSAQLVGSVDPNDLSVVSVLVESLQNKDPKVRKLAAEVLLTVQPRDEAVLQALQEVARDADPAVRKAAESALAKFKKK
jgi:HEAT repeat protein